MRCFGLAMQVAGVLLIASGLAAGLTALFIEDTVPVPAPQVGTATVPDIRLVPIEDAAGSLPRLVAPGDVHEVIRYRVVPENPAVGATVSLTLVLTPADGASAPWTWTERVTLRPGEGPREVALAPRFPALPASAEGTDYRARIVTEVVAEGTGERWTGEGAPASGVRAAPPWVGTLFAPGDLVLNLLQAAVPLTVGGALLAAGLRRFRIEHRRVTIRPAILTGVRPPDS
ncbi:MAG TPA: hypothetical protein VNZ52_03345 [Candidatus Thermoplasmatota archaeon]|nr:hypothetical protein [Candidatus Thermoplasmatota archaeon]